MLPSQGGLSPLFLGVPELGAIRAHYIHFLSYYSLPEEKKSISSHLCGVFFFCNYLRNRASVHWLFYSLKCLQQPLMGAAGRSQGLSPGLPHDRRNPMTWIISTASHDLHEQEATGAGGSCTGSDTHTLFALNGTVIFKEGNSELLWSQLKL